MILGFLGLVTASLFAGAAFYVNFAEQPARLALHERASLIQWQRSYERAAMMQASLALAGFALGLAAWWWEGRDPRWLIGAFLLLAPWPYTLLVIKPVNDKLKAADPLGAGAADSRPDRALGPSACRPHGPGSAGDGDLLLRGDALSFPDRSKTTSPWGATRRVASRSVGPRACLGPCFETAAEPAPSAVEGTASSARGFIHAQPQVPLVWRLRTIWPRLCRPSCGEK